MAWYRKLHWQIIIGLVLGVVFGITAAASGWSKFTSDWISPFGIIFINLLKLIAVPLIIVSLVTGVASLSDLKKLSRIGGKTIAIYMATTVIALIIGLAVVNIMRPGDTVPPEMREQLEATYAEEAESQAGAALATAEERGPLQAIVDIVPENFLSAAGNNRNMLQVVFVAIFLGIGMLMIPAAQAKILYDVFEAANDLVIKLVEVIMIMAPIGVFALMADTITSIAGNSLAQIAELLAALGYYCIAVLLGLAIHMGLTYTAMLKFLTPLNLKDFARKIMPVQLVAFSTSSSGATLPVTMETAEKELGISEEISSFVLPLGATINMDGTGLYQAVAAVFIAQTLGMGLDLAAQMTIVFTAVLASIGTAAVPSAGIVMLVIILESVGVPSAGIALILGVDRILDMCRTVTNVTGDLTVASVVAASENQIAA